MYVSTLAMNADRLSHVLLNESYIVIKFTKELFKATTDFILRNPHIWFPKAVKDAELPDFRKVPELLESSFQISTQK